MEDVWSEEPEYPDSGRVKDSVAVDKKPLAEELTTLRGDLEQLRREKETKETMKQFKFPFKWRWKFNQSKNKKNLEKVLIIFLNKKNEMETPVFVPIYAGNIVIYRNKPYEYDPRGMWRMKGVRGYPSVYLIREIDRRPLINPRTGRYVKDKEGRIIFSKDAAVSNMDIEEVRARGDSTESDEFLIKAALKAYQSQKTGAQINWMVVGIVLLIVVVGAFFLLKSNVGS